MEGSLTIRSRVAFLAYFYLITSLDKHLRSPYRHSFPRAVCQC
ncbi:hypothetical protein PVAG01_08824 [Phlyctema vagabunda]|uniref:Uncharacterized protein n=1 Tax=Phlyctema vagabunda TaxID=108571 RepID=A0ABR4PAH4_9HELO